MLTSSSRPLPPYNPHSPYSSLDPDRDFKSFVPVATMNESHPIRTVEFSPSGEHFTVGTNSKALRICRLSPSSGASSSGASSSGASTSPSTSASLSVVYERPLHHHGSVYCSAWNASSTLIATGSNDKTVKIIALDVDASDSNLRRSIEQEDLTLLGHSGTVRSVAFHNEDPGRLLSTGAGDNLGQIWDVNTTNVGGFNTRGGDGDYNDGSRPVATLRGHKATVHAGKFSPFENFVVGTGGGGRRG